MATYPIPQAGQLVFDFGYHQNNNESYANGYDTGITWDANWWPGGPSVYNHSHHANPTEKHKKMAEDSRFAYDQWHEGFKLGLARRLENNPHFAAWWDENKKNGGTARYVDPNAVE